MSLGEVADLRLAEWHLDGQVLVCGGQLFLGLDRRAVEGQNLFVAHPGEPRTELQVSRGHAGIARRQDRDISLPFDPDRVEVHSARPFQPLLSTPPTRRRRMITALKQPSCHGQRRLHLQTAHRRDVQLMVDCLEIATTETAEGTRSVPPRSGPDR